MGGDAVNAYELAGRICRAVQDKRLGRIGEVSPAAREINPLDVMSERDRQPWLDSADAVLTMHFEDSDRLRSLAGDWDRYGDLAPEKWRNEMRRAVVYEMRILVEKLWESCQ